MKPTLTDVKNLIEQLAEKIHAPKELLPTYGYPIDTGRTDIEIDSNGQIYYFPNERDRERYFLKDMDDLLYYIFNNVTHVMATKHELSNRIRGKDTRRAWFIEQQRLLGILNENWKLRKIKYHDQTLSKHPFLD